MSADYKNEGNLEMCQVSVPNNFEEAWKITKLFSNSPHDILYFTITYCEFEKPEKKNTHLKCTLSYSLVTVVCVLLNSFKKIILQTCTPPL